MSERNRSFALALVQRLGQPDPVGGEGQLGGEGIDEGL